MANVSIIDFDYDERDITVPRGETVKWTNDGGTAHTVTARDGTFNSDTQYPNGIPPGGTFSHSFNRTGTFGYFCRFHGNGNQGMIGSVTVT